MDCHYPLLKFKEPLETPATTSSEWPKYSFHLGYWINENGNPFVWDLMGTSEGKLFAETVKTATREGIDRSESVQSQTTITRSRESLDQSESIFGQTIATKTRESSDQSESAFSFGGRTLLTETREGVDRAENSTW